MPANVYAMRAPTVTTCPGPIWAFPSQLHPVRPSHPSVGGSRQPRGRFRTPYDDRIREQKLREEQEIAVLIAMGVL